MRNAARVLGFVGGGLGVLFALTDLFASGLVRALGIPGGRLFAGLGWGALIASIVGIVGGALAISRPKVAGIIMLVAMVIGFLSLYLFYILPGLLLLIGGLIALAADGMDRP